MTILLVAGLAAYFTFADRAAIRALPKSRTGALMLWLFAVLGVALALFAIGFFVIKALLGPLGEALLLSVFIGAILHYHRVRKARPAETL
jgi:hypothetical protein